MSQSTTSVANPNVAAWSALLVSAVRQPGRVLDAYRAFHPYSVGNQLLALWQCLERGIPVGPIATFPAWKGKGRGVRKGEKALALCMPVTCKTRPAADDDDEPAIFTRFVYKNHWFAYAQTDGPDVAFPALPDWDRTRALATLDIVAEPFAHPNGNMLGYAVGRRIAVNPLNPLPWKTTFHELAHVVLGHTSESAATDDDRTPRSLREVEAESVALICCEALGLAGAEFARGYIQRWLDADAIPEKSAQKIFHAADLILKAGRPA
jgi:hypothetical protein